MFKLHNYPLPSFPMNISLIKNNTLSFPSPDPKELSWWVFVDSECEITFSRHYPSFGWMSRKNVLRQRLILTNSTFSADRLFVCFLIYLFSSHLLQDSAELAAFAISCRPAWFSPKNTHLSDLCLFIFFYRLDNYCFLSWYHHNQILFHYSISIFYF